MSLKNFVCPECGDRIKTFRAEPTCEHDGIEVRMEPEISAPEAKFMEPRNPDEKERGKSVMRNQNQILKERARNYSRDNELHDMTQTNGQDLAKQSQWIGEDGKIRKKIEDL